MDFFILCVALPNIKIESDKYSAWKVDIVPLLLQLFKNNEYPLKVRFAA